MVDFLEIILKYWEILNVRGWGGDVEPTRKSSKLVINVKNIKWTPKKKLGGVFLITVRGVYS